MRFRLPADRSEPVITAKKHIASAHGGGFPGSLPETCVLFELGGALRQIERNYDTEVLSLHLPCFIADSRCVTIRGHENVCFVNGGYGAPSAVDTLETVLALGVRRVFIAGMCGGFSRDITIGDVLAPKRVLCEEGTSRHYYEEIAYAEANDAMQRDAAKIYAEKFPVYEFDTVSCDAIYRQTYAKEARWRDLGCAGVDMEASALLAVSAYYGVPAAAVLLCSDKHPQTHSEGDWNWAGTDFAATRAAFIEHAVAYAMTQ